jgi:nicotinamidase-related amidase
MPEPIWERYLTDQDREHVRRQPPPDRPLGTQPALLLVDLYRWVFGDRPQPLLEAIETWPSSCGLAGWEALPHIQRLLAGAREAGVPVIHIAGQPGLPRTRTPHSRSPGAEGGDAAAAERRQRAYDIVDEVAPLPGEAVFRKAAPSGFFGTPLAAHLTYLRVDTLVVAGESTSGCVRATVVDGHSYRFRMALVEECVFDRHEATHAINLFDMSQKYAALIDLAAALDYFGRQPAPTG